MCDVCRKYIEIEIFDDEDYERKDAFFIELGLPISELAKGEEDVNEAGKRKISKVGILWLGFNGDHWCFDGHHWRSGFLLR